MLYPHKTKDEYWQKEWHKKKAFEAIDFSPKPKYYILNMFPYPSGSGLHMGHIASYTPSDVISRYKKMRGYNVLNPIGYDAFGLPAEQFAIQTGIHPQKTTEQAIENFRRQLQSFGYAFDWNREISTSDPKTYKWTQFIFTILFNNGLAYQKKAPVNWCPFLRTVLANEEVIDGKSERGGHPVERKFMRQWMLKITDFSEKLLNDLANIDWPNRTKEGQTNWIGKSRGATIEFRCDDQSIPVFTTRPDTLFGVTFLVLSPEHPKVEKLTKEPYLKSVQSYQKRSASKSEVQRKIATEKTGVFTGAFAVHPITGTNIPIWIADYVLMDYGTGAIMAVPAADERDRDFATANNLPVQEIIDYAGSEPKLIHSEFLNGLSVPQAINQMIDHLEKKGLGSSQTQYKLRDWLFSRQRYWGEPFPIIHFNDGKIEALPLNELPVIPPEIADYQPSEDGKAPLSRAPKEWLYYRCPKSGREGVRETDTMPGSAGSSWYFLRYLDPENETELCSFKKQEYWMPVDHYIGGPEHTVGHLLYSRFWQKVLFEKGFVTHNEPFQKLTHQGMLLGSDGEKMSKSRGNTINPDQMREEYGADAVKMFILFLGPIEKDKPWQEKGIEGIVRFLDRVWRACLEEKTNTNTKAPPPEECIKSLHRLIKKIEEDIESLSFNTAIAALMSFVNECTKMKAFQRELWLPFIKLLYPFAPHFSEELWKKLGQNGYLFEESWPEYQRELTLGDLVTIGVQVNGKLRGSLALKADETEESAIKLALSLGVVKKHVADPKVIRKVIYKPGRILNLIV